MNILGFWKPAIWLAIILAASLLPGNKLPGVPLFPHADKIIHFFMYFVLAVLLVKPVSLLTSRKPWLWIIAFGILTGSLTELAQELGGLYRSGSLTDQLANTTGTLSGAFFHVILKKYPALNKYL